MAQVWAAKFYASKVWHDVRRQVLRRDLYTCCDCDRRASEVHHKTELTPENINDPRIALNPDNLESLCHDCHTRRTMGFGDIADGYCFSEKGQVIRSGNGR